MTYRRLFHILLVGSTLVLMFLWPRSFWNEWEFFAESGDPKITVLISLHRANFRVHVEEPPRAKWFYGFRSITRSESATFYDMPAPSGVLGGFRWVDTSADTIFGPYRSRGALFPIWVPWLLFIGSSFAFCRLMDRRSKGGRKKALAEEQASATP